MSGRTQKNTEAELALVRDILAKKPGAWEAFYEQYYRLMLSCIRKVYAKHGVVLDEDEQQDLLATVCYNFLKNDFHKLRVYDPDRGHRLSSWVGLISTNTAYDALRKRGPDLASLDDTEHQLPPLATSLPSPLEEVEREEQMEVLARAVSLLTESERRFVQLYYVEKLDPAEVAKRLGVSVNTVYSRKNKVKGKLIRIAMKILKGTAAL